MLAPKNRAWKTVSMFALACRASRLGGRSVTAQQAVCLSASRPACPPAAPGPSRPCSSAQRIRHRRTGHPQVSPSPPLQECQSHSHGTTTAHRHSSVAPERSTPKILAPTDPTARRLDRRCVGAVSFCHAPFPPLVEVLMMDTGRVLLVAATPARGHRDRRPEGVAAAEARWQARLRSSATRHGTTMTVAGSSSGSRRGSVVGMLAKSRAGMWSVV